MVLQVQFRCFGDKKGKILVFGYFGGASYVQESAWNGESYYYNKGGLNRHEESVHQDRSYYCDECGFPTAKKEKLKSHMNAVHRDGEFNVTSVMSQRNKSGELRSHKEKFNKILKIKFIWSVFIVVIV